MTERSIPLAFSVIAGLLMQPAVARPKRVVGKAAFTEAAVNSPETRIPIGPGSSGSAVLRAQILLDRAHFSPGQIDGRFGSDLAVAVKAFRVAKSLPPASRIDAVTWRTLNESADKPALISYTVRASEVKGPFEKIPADMQEKAKLKFLGYESAEEALGAEFHCTPKLLAELNPGKDLSKAGEEILVPNVAARPKVEGTAAQVIVSKSARTVAVVAEDGNVLAIYPATMGSEHDPLPIGEWKITAVRHNPVFNYNPELFWDAKEDDAKARIAPGPKNPVGTVWIGLSKEHYGIHGTPEPGLIGHTQSHGCIRLTNWDVEELAKLVKPGTPAILKE